ncbi:MAG: response regulator [Leptolyngbyaceae cyanobacterium CSU_1_3]|nr:response regulator [Leptolyngbyaceae cyanobacterium CSU_1_3]
MNSASYKKPLIVAVDDNQDNLLLLEYQLLEVIDCQLVTAIDGETALSLIQDKLPDLVLMDVLMPGMDGAEVIRCLKRSPQTASIPVIALTALARNEERELILESGCDDYLSKPYDLADLQTAILRHLGVRSLL